MLLRTFTERLRRVAHSASSRAATAGHPHVWGALLGLFAACVALWTPAPWLVMPVTGLLSLWACAVLSRRHSAKVAGQVRLEARSEQPVELPSPLPGPRDLRIRPPHLYVDDTGTMRGRGAFAAKPFMAGELVEVAPVTFFAVSPGTKLPRELGLLVFTWGSGVFGPDTRALAHGYVSMFNHDSPANCRYEMDLQRCEIRIYTLRGVVAGEELTVNYNCGRTGRDEDGEADWFVRNGVNRAETRLRLPLV